MTRSRTWNLRLNLDDFNAAFAALGDDAEKAQFLHGLSLGMNAGEPREGCPEPTREGFDLGRSMRSEAEVYRAGRVEIGKRGGPASWKHPKEPHGKPEGEPHGSPRGNHLVNHDGTQSTIHNPGTEVPPLTPHGGGEPVGGKVSGKRQGQSKRRGKQEILNGFAPWTKTVLEALAPAWPREDGPPEDRRPIQVSVPAAGDILEKIHQDHPTLPEELTIAAALRYVKETRTRYKAMEYFFGPQGPWKGYINAELEARKRRAEQAAGVTE